MSVDFRRAGLLHKEALLLADRGGDGLVGQLVFLTASTGSDRMHRMDLSRLRRFSIDRESKAVAFTLGGLVAGLLLILGIAALTIDEEGIRWFLSGLVGLLLLINLLWLLGAALRSRVSLTFEDAGRTRSFKAWTTQRKLRRFTDRLEAAVATAQRPAERP